MALVRCPNCGQDISDKAIKCPNCGASIGRIQKIQFTFDHQPRIFKIVIGIIIAIGGVASFLPIFIENPYEPLGINYYGVLYNLQRTPEFILTIGIAAIGALIPLCMFIYIFVQRIRKKTTSWVCWIISLTIAVIAPFSTYFCYQYAGEAFNELADQKLYAAEGTYRWKCENGETVTIAMMKRGDMLFNYEGQYEERQISNICYLYQTDCFAIEFLNDDKSYYLLCDANMKFAYDSKGNKIPIKKICIFPTHFKYNKRLWGVPE